MQSVPEPTQADIPFNAPVKRRLQAGEKLIATFRPEQATTTFHAPIVAISKQPEMQYVVKADGKTRYDAPVPPTDIDDLQVCFTPALSFNNELKVTVSNLSDSVARDVTVQPVGWEEVPDGD